MQQEPKVYISGLGRNALTGELEEFPNIEISLMCVNMYQEYYA